MERLDRGEEVLVNLRPESDPEIEFVAFDRPRVLRVLARVIANLDGLAGFPPVAKEEANNRSPEAQRVSHHKRLAEADPPSKQLAVLQNRAALRDLLDLSPSEKD